MDIELNPQETIDELARRGITLEPAEGSPSTITMVVGPRRAGIPDWLFRNLQKNSTAMARQLSTGIE